MENPKEETANITKEADAEQSKAWKGELAWKEIRDSKAG